MINHLSILICVTVIECAGASALSAGDRPAADDSVTAAKNASVLEWIGIADDGASFVKIPSGEKFIPWGFNYDHDRNGRLIEDYWADEWDTVAEDFNEMAALGANVVRVHLQFGKFMTAPDSPHEPSLRQLSRLIELAERTGIYLNLTGLGCYHKADVPSWYDSMSDQQRWAAQAVFWEAIAKTATKSPAVFCFDLMNEPVVHGGKRKGTDWLGPAFGGKHFVQRITLEPSDRSRPEIARDWIAFLVAAIRKHDRRHLLTVGLVPWSLDRPGLTSGFVPERIAEQLDFVAVHLYPETGKGGEALDLLRAFDVGKPVVIEETFPLKCGRVEFETFLDQSAGVADGWIGFYWGKTPAEYANDGTIGGALTRQWLEVFEKRRPGKPRPATSHGTSERR